jgi:uncharacterized membrane protein YhaH (DUF805 family)
MTSAAVPDTGGPQDFIGASTSVTPPAIPRGLFRFSGRIGRAEFARVTILSLLLLLLVSIPVNVLIPSAAKFGNTPFVLVALWVLLMIPIIVANSAAGIKRCHDMGRPGWHWIASAIPVFGFLFWLYLLVAKGARDSNRYGAAVVVSAKTAARQPPKRPISHSNQFAHVDASLVGRVRGYAHGDQPPTTSLPGFDEHAAYAAIADEIDSKAVDKGQWLKAMVQSGGDKKLHIITYTHLRLQQSRETYLSSLAELQATSGDHALDGSAPHAEASPSADDGGLLEIQVAAGLSDSGALLRVLAIIAAPAGLLWLAAAIWHPSQVPAPVPVPTVAAPPSRDIYAYPSSLLPPAASQQSVSQAPATQGTTDSILSFPTTLLPPGGEPQASIRAPAQPAPATPDIILSWPTTVLPARRDGLAPRP